MNGSVIRINRIAPARCRGRDHIRRFALKQRAAVRLRYDSVAPSVFAPEIGRYCLVVPSLLIQ